MATPSRAPPRRGGQSGLVLLEILVALAIFSGVVLAWANATDSAVRASVRANQERILRMLVARKLAEVRAIPSDYEEDGEGGFEEEVDYGETNPYEDYRWRVQVRRVAAAGHTEDEEITHAFSPDEEAVDPAPAAEGGEPAKPQDPRILLEVVLTVQRIATDEEEGESFRATTYLPDPEKDGEEPK